VSTVQKFYETLFIMRPTLTDQEIAELIENYRGILVREGAEILYQQDMGKKKLAYTIRHFQNGHYALYRYKSGPAAVRELERSMKINEDVLRCLTVNLNDKEVAAAAAAVAAAAASAAAAAAAAEAVAAAAPPVEG
jgi:small subunit ribosomal protein S6